MGLKECGLNLSRDNKELKPHGTIDFPCAGYSSCYRDSEDDIIPWHWHPELEILYIKYFQLRMPMPRYDIILTVPVAGRITGTGKIDSSVRLQFFIVTAQIKTAFFQSHSDLLF